jgi:vacuolar-type H+-ATPase subunit C/Vma6
LAGSGKYAKVTPKLRVIKSRMLPRETLREILLSPNLEEASTLLKDTEYSEISGATAPSTIQSITLKVFFERLFTMEKALPKEAKQIPRAFAREEEAKDVLAIMKAVYEGKQLPLLPTAGIPGTIAFIVKRDPETLVSMQRLQEFLARTWFKKYAQSSLRLANEVRSPEVFSWYATAVSLTEYTLSLQGLGRRDRRGVEQILCPYLEYKFVSTLANAKTLGISVRILDRIIGDLRACGTSWRELRNVYEREPGAQEILSALREEFPALALDTKLSVEQALEQARKTALKNSAAKAGAAYSGYPFTPVLAAAAAMLSKIEYLDLTTILTGILLKIPPDELESLLISF